MAGMSLRELSEQVGVSAQAISKYERGQDTPGSRPLMALADALGVRCEYFLRPAPPAIDSIEFRKRSGLPKKAERAIVETAQDWLERYLAAEEIAIPSWKPDIPCWESDLKVSGDIESVAERLRDEWKLGRAPLESLTELLEDHGIKVMLIDAHDQFDGLAIHSGEHHAVVLQRDRPGDRQRFNLAHELGHIIAPNPKLAEDLQGKEREKTIERYAHRFAGAFLVPKQAAIDELGKRRTKLDLYELHLLKHKYGLSMLAWVFRAKDLGIISDRLAETWFMKFSRNGWRSAEPGDELPSEDEPTRLHRLVLKAWKSGTISESRASELLGLPMSDFWEQVKQKHNNLPVGLDN